MREGTRVELSLSGHGVTIGTGALAYLYDAACWGCERGAGKRDDTTASQEATRRRTKGDKASADATVYVWRASSRGRS